MRRISRSVFSVSLLFLLGLAARAQTRSPDFARALSANLGLQGRVMWVDATANLERLKTRAGVADIVARCKKASITTIVVDVKPISGQVLYNSKIAAHLTSWKGKEYPVFDTLAAFVEEGHRAGLEIAASCNVFTEGHKYFNVGLAYSKRDWQSITYIVERAFYAHDGARLPVRATEDSDDPSRTLVYKEDFVLEPAQAPGDKIAVALDEENNVAGIIDAALLENEPLSAPEDGRLIVFGGPTIDWATRHLRAGDRTRFGAVGRRVPVTEAASEKVAAFINPLHPEARRYELSLLQEIAQNYDVDAIVFDRMRYANLYNDYSDLSRAAFEKWLGRPVSRWPDDVIQFDPVPGEPLRRGPLFKPWLEFRARVIREFVREATDALRAVKPNLQFGTYVGSWFTEYYGVGVNWGSEKFPVTTAWASPDYNQAGYAEFLDWVSTGCYYSIPTRLEARAQRREEGGTVEAAAELSLIAVANSAPVYAGLYALNYQGQPETFARAIAVAAQKSQGVMLFDISYIYDYDWWNLLEQAFSQPAAPPHRYPDLAAQLRAVQDAARSLYDALAARIRLPAVPYQPGGG